MHNDLVKKALDVESDELSNDDLIRNYLNTNVKNTPISSDKIELGDIVEVLEEEEVYDPMEHDIFADDINIKENIKP